LQGKKFFFFFSLALVSSFGRRLEEEGDGFGKLKSLQGVCEKDTEDYQWSVSGLSLLQTSSGDQHQSSIRKYHLRNLNQ
jgi:hypothetical protein